MKDKTLKKLVFAALFAALACVATMVIKIPTPTGGYIHAGDAVVLLSAFIDNIPYVATMLPVVQGIAGLMGEEPYVFYFGLLTGATLGGNMTPLGASANITAIGILRKNGETVTTRDFLRGGVPFTLAAVLVGAVYIWLVWGMG